MNRTHVSRPCSRRLARSCLTVKIASEQPRQRRKPRCASWSSFSIIGSVRAARAAGWPRSCTPPRASLSSVT
eukprot:4490153-Prymnesium_polylepis.1